MDRDLLNHAAELKELAEVLEQSSLGRALSLLVDLAEEGLEARKRSYSVDGQTMAEAAIEADEDRLIGPQRIEEILGFPWRYCRENLIPEYGPDVNGSGKGKTTRYLLSDIYRIRDRVVDASETEVI